MSKIFNMNLFFSLILVASIAMLIATSPNAVLGTMMTGVQNSLIFAATLFASYGVWMSTMKIWERCNLNGKIGKLLLPPIKILFPEESQNTYNMLAVNISANLLGMGGAATPAGIDATTSMTSSKNQIMLAVLNGTSIQLLPTTVIAMRAAKGATTDILLPSIIASLATTIIGILLVKIFVRK